MINQNNRHALGSLAALWMTLISVTVPALGQPIRIGELNSYRSQPAFLEPYRQGWRLAQEEINSEGGVGGRTLEVISRDDLANPADAVRVAQSLITQDGAQMLFGTFLSDVGLAVSDFAREHKTVFLAAEPLTDKITWQNGNRYTFRLATSTYMQVAMLVPEAARLKKKRWALVYPNDEYGQSAADTFRRLLKRIQPDVEFVAAQAPASGRVDGGTVTQAIEEAAPDAIFNVLFGADLAKFVREGHTRGLFGNRPVVSLLSGWPEYLDPLRDETPVGWIVTAYPWYAIRLADHDRFVRAYQARWSENPKQGSLIGYIAMQSIAAAIRKAGGTHAERLVAAFKGLDVHTPLGPIRYRAIDHQATLGTFVGVTGLQDGVGIVSRIRYIDGATVMPSDEAVRVLRPGE